MLISYFFLWMAPPLYLMLMMVALLCVMWIPAHFGLRRFMQPVVTER